VSLKKRSEEEINKIISDFEGGESVHTIAVRHEVSESQIYRILQKHYGRYKDPNEKRDNKIKKLEKQLAEREKEIALLRAALKKL